MDYLSVEQARTANGLRLVLTAGVPGPWGEAAKAILNYKGIAFLPVFQEGGGENTELLAWTGQTSAPVAVLDDEPPVCHWLDLLMLSERMAPQKPLLPHDAADRALCIGLSALIAGVDGFGWNRRMHMLAPMLALPEPPDMARRLAAKYGWSDAALAGASDRLDQISECLNAQMLAQQALGREYLVGESVTAADFYWANFAGMVKPLPPQDNPMPDFLRGTYQATDERTLNTVTPALEALRDRMYERHITLPLSF